MRGERREQSERRENRFFQISNWNPDFLWVSKINQDDPTKRDELLRWIGSYGFLLENEMLKALGRKNSKLIAPAIARINFLSTKVDKYLLRAASGGKEDAIISILTFLMNEGWWERARKIKLKDFGFDLGISEERWIASEKMIREYVHTYKDLVHPGVLKMVAKHDPEGLDLALNHIHYGSLKQRRLVREQKVANQDFFKEIGDKVDQTSMVESQKKADSNKEALIKFIYSHGEKVDQDILQRVAYNQDEAITKALQQIHSVSLSYGAPSNHHGIQSYLEAVKTKKVAGSPKPSPSSVPDFPLKSGGDSLFFSGFDGVEVKEIWKGVKQIARVKNIVFPARVDRYNKKFGFIKPVSYEDALRLIKVSNQLRLGGKRVRIEWARPKRVASKSSIGKQFPVKESPKEVRMGSSDTKDLAGEPIQINFDAGMEDWFAMLERSMRIELAIDYAPDSLVELIRIWGSRCKEERSC